LITALKDIGADCSQYEHLGKTETVQESWTLSWVVSESSLGIRKHDKLHPHCFS
jgi:hypothetical protein